MGKEPGWLSPGLVSSSGANESRLVGELTVRQTRIMVAEVEHQDIEPANGGLVRVESTFTRDTLVCPADYVFDGS